MQTQHQATAHSLYVLYQALPEPSKQLFLKELLGEQAEALILSLQNRQPLLPQATQQGNYFADICGILKSTRSVSLDEMERVISRQGWDGFIAHTQARLGLRGGDDE
ncbi:MAG: hypothetical protein LVS60_04960 [Nodosilinea sp. LVE1205-7]|jgi:hypothetical protein